MFFIGALIAIISLLYYWLKLRYEYWNKRGVPGPKPTLLIGNLGDSLLMKKSALEIYADIYREYKKYPFVGVYKTTTPVLLICEPELIKDITVKSFQHFHDNDIEIDQKIDPIFGRNPFCLKGEEWKTVRSQLTPGFTSGKMKSVYPLLQETSRSMVTFIHNLAKKKDAYELKKLCKKFTLNNVASCAFGLEAKAFSDETTEFQVIAKEFFNLGMIENFLFLLLLIIPQLSKVIRLKYFPHFSKSFSLKFVKKDVEDRLTNIVAQTLKYREENNIVRNDFLHILKQLKTTCKEYEFTDVDVTAHAAGFFIDGFETSATAMSFILYELAADSQAQSKLRKELLENFDSEEDCIPYDVLQGLPYLDAVVNETLRMHPPLFSLGKICTKTYTYIPKESDGIGKPVVIEKGTPIVLPLSGLQRDPDYFPNPNVFDPERFVGARKDKIKKYTFMPFGEGPRACLGQRFGLLQIKSGIAHVIKNFRLTVNAKTKTPIRYDPVEFITTPVGGLWIDFEKISD